MVEAQQRMESEEELIARFKAQGVEESIILEAIAELKQEQAHVNVQEQSQSRLQESYNRAMAYQQNDPRMYASNTMVSGNQNQDNLIKWQLELDSILERIEHMLRGDKPQFINGSLIYIPPNDNAERVFNDFGVQEIMRVLSMYLNRNTILSNYDDETINWKVLDFGKEVSDLIFLKYEAFGLDTLEKRKLYPMIVRQLVDAVHSGYLRALNGGERESLRTARSVAQTEPIGQGGMPMAYPVKERGMLNPMRWLKGKYAM